MPSGAADLAPGPVRNRSSIWRSASTGLALDDTSRSKSAQTRTRQTPATALPQQPTGPKTADLGASRLQRPHRVPSSDPACVVCALHVQLLSSWSVGSRSSSIDCELRLVARGRHMGAAAHSNRRADYVSYKRRLGGGAGTCGENGQTGMSRYALITPIKGSPDESRMGSEAVSIARHRSSVAWSSVPS